MRHFLILMVGILLSVFVAVTIFPEEKKTLSVVLDAHNFTSIRSEIDGYSISKVISDIDSSEGNQKPYYLYLDSLGGDVFAGRALIGYLKSTDKNVICIARTAISMAFMTLEVGCKNRLILDDAVLMSHQISASAQGSLKVMQATINLVAKLEDYYDKQAANRLQLSLAEYRSKIDPEFWMVGSEDILANKAADSLVTISCDKSLNKLKVKIVQSSPFGNSEREVSKCPLLLE